MGSGGDSGWPSTTAPTEAALCELKEFRHSYGGVHGYLGLFVCVFGLVANILNIVVLTRKEMNVSPINRLLTGIAVADMLVMLDYVPFLIHAYLWTDGRRMEEQYAWRWSAVLWFHAHFSTVIHNVSVFLTLSIAVWRYIVIQFHTLAPIYCTMHRCHVLLGVAYSE